MANTIDKTAIDAARDKIKARLARVRAVDEGRAQDKASDLIDDGVAIDGSVVVARGVTQAVMDAIPPAWLGGDTILDLTADGVLTMKAAEGYQHASGVDETASIVRTYARDTGLETGSGPIDLPTLGATMYPDAVLWARNGDVTGDPYSAFVIFELEVTHRTFNELVRLAITYLDQLESVQRVVCIKVFPAREGPLAAQQLQFPAVLVVFERHEGNIRVAQMQSFGNADVDDAALGSLAQADDAARLDPFPQACLFGAAAPQLPRLLPLGGFHLTLDDLWKNEEIKMPFEIEMPGSYKSIALDLKELFVCLARGWAQDLCTASDPILVSTS